MNNKCKIILLISIKLIIIIIIQLLGVGILLKEDLLKSINLDYEQNDFCQTIKNVSENNLDYYVCNNKFKKNKVIFLLIDSLPFDSLHDFLNLKEMKMPNLFRGEGIEYKQSGALFETILTGKFSRNYLASNEMKMDNLQKQFNNANMDIFYHIKDFPLYGLLNKTLIDKNKIDKNIGEMIPLLTFCQINIAPFLSFRKEVLENYFDDSGLYFKEGLNQEILYQRANEKLRPEFEKIRKNFNYCFSKMNFSSYVFFTDTMDHINHISHRSSPLSLYAIFVIENFVKELINWINEEHG